MARFSTVGCLRRRAQAELKDALEASQKAAADSDARFSAAQAKIEALKANVAELE